MASGTTILPSISGGGSSGVTAVSVATANGISGNSSGGTTPELTLQATTTPGALGAAVSRDAGGFIEDFEPAYVMNVFEHFTGYQPTSSNSSFQNSAHGTGAKAGSAGGDTMVDTSHPGIVRLQTGTDTDGSAIIYTGQSFVWGAGEAFYESEIYIPTLPDVTDDADIWAGFGNTFQTNDTPPDTGLWFEWNQGVNSGNWRVGFGNGTATYQNTSVAPVGGTWAKLGIVVAADAASARFYIDGVLVSTVTDSHIPHAIANSCNMFFRITKLAGTNNRQLVVDYVRYRQIFTTPH